MSYDFAEGIAFLTFCHGLVVAALDELKSSTIFAAASSTGNADIRSDCIIILGTVIPTIYSYSLNSTI